MGANSLINKATDLDFFKEMFARAKDEPVKAVSYQYYTILSQKKLIHELFNEEALKTPEYQKCWAGLFKQYFSYQPINLEHRDVCLWAFPFLITSYKEEFTALSTNQSSNKTFQDFFKIVKNTMGANVTSEQLSSIIKSVSKIKDIDVAITIAEQHPSLVTNQKDMLIYGWPKSPFYNLDKSGKVAKLAEVLNVTAIEFYKKWLFNIKNYNFNVSVESLSYYWANKIFNGTEIEQSSKYAIFSQYFAPPTRDKENSYLKEQSSDNHFLYRLYMLVNANKNSPKTLEIMLPYIRQVLSQEKSLSKLFQKTNTKTENNFLWLLNFMKEHRDEINSIVDEPQAVLRLQTSLIKLEQKKIQQSVKKVMPSKSSEPVNTFKL